MSEGKFHDEEVADGLNARYVVEGEDASGMFDPWREMIAQAEVAVSSGNHEEFMDSLIQLYKSIRLTLDANVLHMEMHRRADIIRKMQSN
jgi:hypothetical protein